MLQSNHRPNRDGFLGYLSAPRCGRVITVIGQVSSENVELAGDHPPRVTDFYLVLRGQEHPKLACREGRRRHCWALPGPQPAQRAVRNLKEMEEGNFGKHKLQILSSFILDSIQGCLHLLNELHSQRAE